jgi:type I restriction enzyme M protein
MENLKKLLEILNFKPVNGENSSWVKLYSDYKIIIDLKDSLNSSVINWGDRVNVKRSTTSNFSQEETLVVLECVDRLLEKGYKPQDIILEDSWKLGHKGKGFLDISVKKDGQTFLMIECKTWGKEYEKELNNLHKDGGQLLSYFQQDKSAQYLVLHTSRFEGGKIEYKNDIIVIEQSYRETNNLKDLFERWNKLTNKNGVFDDWVKAYDYQNKTLTKKDLKHLKEEDSGYIFNQFLSILRRHAISNKANAFEKIFNLFLAKIFDEKKGENKELEFQWKEGIDDEVDFEVRLINLYKEGMKEFLTKEVEGIEDNLFQAKDDKSLKESKRKVLKLYNVFKIKEVNDEESFMDNFRVLKDVVLLLQEYKIRYPRKQRHLSDFFERLLTTGLKQESGQFFTPPTVAKFIVRSLPFLDKIEEKLKVGNGDYLLPNIIDYACGSGHFLTESMEEMQNIIDNLEVENLDLIPDAEKKVKIWRVDKYDWAAKYIYGIEKDDRLVKVAKVGCYFYGDGLAQVIHGDGLDSFTNSKSYRGLLKQDSNYPSPNNPKFDFILANPPYSVDNFKLDLKNKDENSFELYKYLTDNSSEIEVLFIERTKQLLAKNGVAGVILPSSILSNTGLYTKAREILLKHFEIKAIAEFGSNTFMATGTNTIVLFLQKRENGDKLTAEIQKHIQKAFEIKQDLTINGIQNLISKYVKNTEQKITLDEYLGLFKNDEIEQEKVLYFALTYAQKIVLVKTGEKDEEKKFLGYYFSNRRGHEGIKPFVAGQSIDECTYLYDENELNNPKVASSYIQKAFAGELENLEIDSELSKNISVVNLSDLLDFESKKFEKIINTRSKKKLKYRDFWGNDNLVFLPEIAEIKKGSSITLKEITPGEIPVIAGGKKPAYFHNQSNRDGDVITVSASGANSGFVNYHKNPIFASDCNTIKSKDESRISTKLIYEYLIPIQDKIYLLQRGQAQPHVYAEDLAKIEIPLPPLNIQTQILTEIEKIENEGQKAKSEIERLKNQISELVENSGGKEVRLAEVAEEIFAGGDKPNNFSKVKTDELQIPIYANSIENKGLIGYSNIVRVEKPCVTISARGSIGFCVAREEKFFPIVRLVVLIADLQKALPIYLEYKLNSIKIEQSGTNIPQLTVPMVEEIKIQLPSLQIQQKIVAQIQEIEKKIESLQTVLDSVKTQKEQVLKKYL